MKNPLQFVPVTKCWVCEGWSENTFVITPNKSLSNIEEPLHVHFDYNHYQPELMTQDFDGNYKYTTMCPPGKLRYFFSIDKIAALAKDHPRQYFKIPKTIENIEQYDEVKNYRMAKINFRMVEQREVLDGNYSSLLKKCIPRPKLNRYVRPEVEEIRDPWEFPKSIFAKFIQDNEEIMAKCFEHDWALCGKPKLKEGKKNLSYFI